MSESPFILSVTLSVDPSGASEDVKGIEELLCCLSGPDLTPNLPVLVSDDVCLKSAPLPPSNNEESNHQSFALIFCPSTLVDSALESVNDSTEGESSSFLHWYDNGLRISQRLLSMLHPFLERNFAVKALIRPSKDHSPADLVLVDLSHSPLSAIADLLEATVGQTIHSGPERVLKVILLRSLNIQTKERTRHNCDASNEPKKIMAIGETARFPTCPVCLHRIDPIRLRLPKPRELCSRFCPPPNVPSSRGSSWSISCPRQRLLHPWPLPNHCEVCSDIQIYWKPGENAAQLFACADCGLKETLWVCLTCGFIGCGRYSNKHSVEHNMDSGHPFCLELSTLRIWSYKDGEFAHRTDLLECPSSQPLLQPLLPDDDSNRAGYAAAAMTPLDESLNQSEDYGHKISSFSSAVDEMKAPKKATMIGEEYEALLYSALEDQAQHYQGEMSRLKARLAEEQLDRSRVTDEEQKELDRLHREIATLQHKVDIESKTLLEAQANEAKERETSQRLLREQQVAKDILQRIQNEIKTEAQQGQMEIDDLEQQIADLTANQRMMQEFSTSEDLRNAQIFGTEQSRRNKPIRRNAAKKSAKKKR